MSGVKLTQDVCQMYTLFSPESRVYVASDSSPFTRSASGGPSSAAPLALSARLAVPFGLLSSALKACFPPPSLGVSQSSSPLL